MVDEDRRLDPTSSCTPQAARALVGRVADTRTTEEARRLARATSVRVLRPGEPASQDYQSHRLTVDADDKGRIVRFFCG